MSELRQDLDRWIDDNTVDGDFIAHPDFVYDKLLEMQKEIEAQRETLTKIFNWDSHPACFEVNYGSNGVRDLYRNMASKHLKGVNNNE